MPAKPGLPVLQATPLPFPSGHLPVPTFQLPARLLVAALRLLLAQLTDRLTDSDLNFRIGYQRVAGNDVAMLIVLDAIGGGVLEGCEQIIDGYRILDLRTGLTGCIGLLVEIDKQCAVTFGIQAFRQCH